MIGQPTHVGGQAAHSQARSGPTMASVVCGPLLPEFCDFHNRIPFCCHGVSPPTCFLFTFMHNMWRQNTYPNGVEVETTLAQRWPVVGVAA